MPLDVLLCKELMGNVENSPGRIFRLFPKHVTFTPRYGQSALGNTLKQMGIHLNSCLGKSFLDFRFAVLDEEIFPKIVYLLLADRTWRNETH